MLGQKITALLFCIFSITSSFAARSALGGEEQGTAGFDKDFHIRSGDGRYKLNIGGYIQMQASHETLAGAEDLTGFSLKKARLQMSGNFFEKWAGYGVLVELAKKNPELLDFYVDLTPSRALRVRAGQFKVPFTREYVTSSTDLQTVDLSIESSEFSLGRDQGVAVWQSSAAGILEYSAGIFNGNDINKSNEDTKLLYAARFVLTPFGPFAYSQADLTRSQEPVAAAGVAAAWMPGLKAGVKLSNAGLKRLNQDADVVQLTVDAGLKYSGLSVEGDLSFRRIAPASGGGTEDAIGFRLQAGYFPFNNGLEFVWRYAWVDPATGASDDAKTEFTPGVNYYLNGHRVKVQAAYSYIVTENPAARSGSRSDQKFLVMGQLYF